MKSDFKMKCGLAQNNGTPYRTGITGFSVSFTDIKIINNDYQMYYSSIYLYLDYSSAHVDGGVYGSECCICCSPGDSGGVQTGGSDCDQAHNQNKYHQRHLQ